MSGLEKFQGTSEWLTRFKTLLMADRLPKSPVRDLDSSGDSTICIDFNEDLHVILEEKSILPKMMSSKNKENILPEKDLKNNEISSKNDSTRRGTKYSILNESAMNPMSPNGAGSSFEITNVSFSTLEQACNKSVSDPDSTIHSYVEMIRMKSLSKNSACTDQNDDDENEAIDRLLRDLDAEEKKYKRSSNNSNRLSNSGRKMLSTSVFNDQTQLGDIEEPSGLWETTVTGDNNYQLSPTKMVGLLRPSTIFEESCNSTESDNSATSFNTAQKTNSGETTNYDTASDTIASVPDKSEINVLKTKIEVSDEDKTSANYSLEFKKNNLYNNDLLTSNNHSQTFNTHYSDSLDSHGSSRRTFSDNTSYFEDSLNQRVHLHSNNNLNKSKYNTDTFDNSENVKETAENASFVIELSDDDESNDCEKSQNELEENELNEGFSVRSIEDDSILNETLNASNSNLKGLNVSQEFNDTLEEVEYIMKQGMQMLSNSGTKPKIVQDIKIKSATRSISPIPLTPSPIDSPVTAIKMKKPKTIIQHQGVKLCDGRFSPSPKNLQDIKPINTKGSSSKKLITSGETKDFFKRPHIGNSSRIPQPKSISNVKKYANIISPIAAYINKTPVCPSEAKIKETTVRSLDYGQATGKANIQYNVPKRYEYKFGDGPSLPQKLYKSANYKYVVDERKPLNIPGGEKIHKYLKTALLPAVVRHDGKMKMGSPREQRSLASNNVNSTVNSTFTDLGDLSTMSGDVSIYTLRDAQNFDSLKGKM